MTWDLVKQILSNATVTAMILAAIGGSWKVIKDKMLNRRIDDRDAIDKLADFQAAAEDHILNYDVPIVQRLMQHEALINQERIAAGREPVVFAPLPKPVPLYTRPRKDKTT